MDSQTGMKNEATFQLKAANVVSKTSVIIICLFFFHCSKIQKYSPTESAKVYDKAVNRKSKVHFNPRQTLDYLKSDAANQKLSFEAKKHIVKQYLDVCIEPLRNPTEALLVWIADISLLFPTSSRC